jgi:cobalt/nickel transport protein
MSCIVRTVLVFGICAAFCATALGHFNMLLPQMASVKRRESVTLVYQWGHPFEHQLFNAPQPESVVVLSPDGTKIDLTGKWKKVTRPVAGKDGASAYQLEFTPADRGDYVFVLHTPPIWIEEDQEFLQDTVKTVLHVQVQKGWSNTAGNTFELMPLTRPYGLQPGMVFQAQALFDDPSSRPPGGSARPLAETVLAGALVEIERYNPEPPKELPADEFITRTVRTDPKGVATATLTEPGWWSITAERDGGKRIHAGKAYPLRRRATLWVFVDKAKK